MELNNNDTKALLVFNRNLTVLCKIPSTRLFVFLFDKPLIKGIVGNINIKDQIVTPFFTGIDSLIVCESSLGLMDLPPTIQLIESVNLIANNNLDLNNSIRNRTFPEIWRTYTPNKIPSYLISCLKDSSYDIHELKTLITSNGLYCKKRDYWIDIDTLEVRLISEDQFKLLKSILDSYFVRPIYIHEVLDKSFIPMRDCIYEELFNSTKMISKPSTKKEQSEKDLLGQDLKLLEEVNDGNDESDIK